MNYDELYGRLAAEGYTTQREAPRIASPAPGGIWYTRVMLGFAGWIAGLFLVGFFAGTFVMLMRTPSAMLALGLGLCVAAVVIDRYARGGDVIPQVALAIGLAGRTLYALGVAGLAGSSDHLVAAWAVVALEVVLFVALKSSLHRVLGVMVAAAALYFALHKVGAAGAASLILATSLAFLWGDEGWWRTDRRLHEGGAALAWGLAIVVVLWPLPSFFLREAKDASRLLETAGYAAGLLLLVWKISQSMGGRAGKGAGLAMLAVVVLTLAAHRAPGVVAGSLVLLAGLASGRPALAAWGAMGVVGYLSVFYYQLDQTLLAKSASLAAAGAMLLAGRFVTHHMAKGDAR